jgi:hypothetical protein
VLESLQLAVWDQSMGMVVASKLQEMQGRFCARAEDRGIGGSPPRAADVLSPSRYGLLECRKVYSS